MKRKIDVGSVFGNAQRTSYEYMKLLNKEYNGEFKVLVVDDKDGLHSIPFANHGANVVMYEPNEVYIKGGVIADDIISPIINRKYYKEYKNNIEIRNKNFYEERVEDKYNFVYCYRSLNEKDISNFSVNQYFRSGEMKRYFDPRFWEVITLIEHNDLTYHEGHPYHKKNHTHRVGHVFARKINRRLVHKYYYEIIGLSSN